MQNNQDILDALEFQVTCNVGREHGYAHGRITPCARPANWTLRYHECTPDTATSVKGGTWCNHHLELFRLSIQTQIQDNTDSIIGCVTCHQPFASADDFVWGTAPLNPQK